MTASALFQHQLDTSWIVHCPLHRCRDTRHGVYCLAKRLLLLDMAIHLSLSCVWCGSRYIRKLGLGECHYPQHTCTVPRGCTNTYCIQLVSFDVWEPHEGQSRLMSLGHMLVCCVLNVTSGLKTTLSSLLLRPARGGMLWIPQPLFSLHVSSFDTTYRRCCGVSLETMMNEELYIAHYTLQSTYVATSKRIVSHEVAKITANGTKLHFVHIVWPLPGSFPPLLQLWLY